MSKVHFSEMPGDDNAAPCPLLRFFSDAPVAVWRASRISIRRKLLNLRSGDALCRDRKGVRPWT